MKNRNINGTETSLLGLGCMRLPVIDDQYGQIDYEKAEEIFLTCFNNGVRFFDTAYVYHEQTSEGFLGDMIKKHNVRDQVLISDKVPSWLITCHEDFMKYLDEMLERLQMDYLDYCFIHALDVDRWEKMLEHDLFSFIEEAKSCGKIKNVGFSFHDKTENFEKIARGYHWDFGMIMFNYMDINNQGGLEAYRILEEENIPMFVMEGLKGGRLANPPQVIYDIYANAGMSEKSPVEIAFRWTASHPNVKMILSGISTNEQALENVEIFSRLDESSLTEAEEKMYQTAMDKFIEMTEVDCTDCKYCMPCPVGVDIPWCFQLYNEAHIYNKEVATRDYFSSFIPSKQRANNCVACGKCEQHCPQQIKIIDKLKEAAEYFR